MISKNKLKEKISSLTVRVWLVDFYLQEAQNLEKKESTLRVCDLDDTLFSRQEQLESEELLRNNRWAAGNTIILNTLGLHTYTQKNYHTNFPKDIFSLLDAKNDLILTAGMPELQHMKARNMWILDYNIRIVDEAEEKILETIRYVLFELQYIPKEIIVYEDRPKYFIEYRELIESVLWTKLSIVFVEMNGNLWYTRLESI